MLKNSLLSATLILLCGNFALAADGLFDEKPLNNINFTDIKVKKPPLEMPIDMPEEIYRAWVDAWILNQRSQHNSSESVVFLQKPYEQDNKIIELTLNCPPSQRPLDMDEHRFQAWVDVWELSQRRAFSRDQKFYYKYTNSEDCSDYSEDYSDD